MLKPAPNMIAVKRTSAPSMSPGGIALPEGHCHDPQSGLVVAVGDGIRVIADGEPVKVWFSWGVEIEYQGEKYTMVKSADVLAYSAPDTQPKAKAYPPLECHALGAEKVINK